MCCVTREEKGFVDGTRNKEFLKKGGCHYFCYCYYYFSHCAKKNHFWMVIFVIVMVCENKTKNPKSFPYFSFSLGISLSLLSRSLDLFLLRSLPSLYYSAALSQLPYLVTPSLLSSSSCCSPKDLEVSSIMKWILLQEGQHTHCVC